jgi:DNA helicase-2/ATP-dependent DNA helicase PcrA
MTHIPQIQDTPETNDDHADDHVDDEIEACLNLEKPVSFFLSAGAGSGKTRSVVTALCRLRARDGHRLRMQGRRIGVITYTNAACDEIKSRLEYDPLIEVSTIHSFVWSLIAGFNEDIRHWLSEQLAAEIAELQELLRKGRAGTKAALDRAESIKSKQKRLEALPQIRQFTYNPSGDSTGRDSLSHTEVIKIGADFLGRRPLMKHLLISSFPVLLIDESQDTNKLLMEAFLNLQQEYKDKFCLGLFGDTMQRIYGDGKEDLGRHLPPDWAKPAKALNHRSPRRVIRLINKIRSVVDDHQQRARSDSEEGVVRLFVFPGDIADKADAERKAAREMAAITGDPLWIGAAANVKALILEHHMAARRMGFLEMFQSLYQIDKLQTGLRDGLLPGLRFFSDLASPVLKAKARGDEFAIAAILRKASPLLSKASLLSAGDDQRANIRQARDAVSDLTGLWRGNSNPTFLDVLKCVWRSGLFEIPDCFQPMISRLRTNGHGGATAPMRGEDQDPEQMAWETFLSTPFVQIEQYDLYVRGQAPFETHQGVKGREFPRVMVVMDDAEARGFLFSYEKLFAAKDKTKSDFDNEREGKETGIDRTRRLFYVTCSRTQKSLAIVAYSSRPDRAREHVVREGWLDENEVLTLA